MTGNVHDNCYLHIHLLPTHLQLASADFICLLPVVASADPHSHLLPIAVANGDEIIDFICTVWYIGDRREAAEGKSEWTG